MNISQTAIDDIVNDFCDPAKNPLMKELEDYLGQCEKTISLHQAFQQEFQKAMDKLSQDKILKDLKSDQT